MLPIAKTVLPAVTTPASFPARRPAGLSESIRPVVAIEEFRQERQRQIITDDRPREVRPRLMDSETEEPFQLISLPPRPRNTILDTANPASAGFLTQLYGQSRDDQIGLAMESGPLALKAAMAAYQRAGAEPRVYPEQAVVFSRQV